MREISPDERVTLLRRGRVVDGAYGAAQPERTQQPRERKLFGVSPSRNGARILENERRKSERRKREPKQALCGVRSGGGTECDDA